MAVSIRCLQIAISTGYLGQFRILPVDMGVADFQRQMSKRKFGATVIWGLLVISLCLIVTLGSGCFFLLLEGGGVVGSCPPSPVQNYSER